MATAPVTARTVSSLRYVSHQRPRDTAPYDYLRINFENSETAFVRNASFSLNNNALAVMAFLGASPSSLSEAEGERLPVVYTTDGPAPPKAVVESGRRLLAEAAWGPSVAEGDGEEVEVE